MMKNVCLAALGFILLLATGVPAAESSPAPKAPPKAQRTPSEVVEKTVGEVIAILKQAKDANGAKRLETRKKIREALLGVMDMELVCTLSLGAHKKKFSEKQFKKCIDLFSQLLFITYITHLEKYTDEKVEITGEKETSSSRKQVITKTIAKTKDIAVLYSLVQKEKGGPWKLYDVRVEGVSMIRNYRAQFHETLVKKSPDKFLEDLEEKVKKNEENLVKGDK